MSPAFTTYSSRIVFAISTCLTGVFALIWLGSLFYFSSFTFTLPQPLQETRVEAGYGMLYLTLNPRVDPRSRWTSHGIVEFPKFHRDKNVESFLELRFPKDDLYGEATMLGFRKTTQEYQHQTETYSRYWCSAPIPSILFFVISAFSFFRMRCLSRPQCDPARKANSELSVSREVSCERET